MAAKGRPTQNIVATLNGAQPSLKLSTPVSIAPSVELNLLATGITSLVGIHFSKFSTGQRLFSHLRLDLTPIATAGSADNSVKTVFLRSLGNAILRFKVFCRRLRLATSSDHPSRTLKSSIRHEQHTRGARLVASIPFEPPRFPEARAPQL